MRKLFLILSLFMSLGALAQSVSGTLIDEESHPISFVAFSNINTKIGGYTDEGGRFTLDISGLKESDEVVFSHLGYVEVKMTVAQLSALKDPIQMKPKNYALQEVVVGPGDAKNVLLDALAHIKDNYPSEFTNNHILFKDYSVINKEPNYFINFDFNMYVASYLAKDSAFIYTTDNKHQMYEKKGTLFGAQIKPTLVMKAMYPERLFNKKLLEEAAFQMATTSTVIDGEEYSVIEFSRKPQKEDPAIVKKGGIYFKGHVYINKKDQGIRFIDLHVYNQNAARYMLVTKMDSLNFNAKVAYIKVDGKYVLDYISQSFTGSGNIVGKHMDIFSSSSAKVLDRKLHLKMNEIVMKAEVDDIFEKEKKKDIKEMKGAPDMR